MKTSMIDFKKTLDEKYNFSEGAIHYRHNYSAKHNRYTLVPCFPISNTSPHQSIMTIYHYGIILDEIERNEPHFDLECCSDHQTGITENMIRFIKYCDEFKKELHKRLKEEE